MLQLLIPLLFFAQQQNITCIYNISDIGTLIGCDSTATDGYLGITLLVVLFIIGAFGLMAVGVDMEIAALTIGIICTFIGVIMAAMQPPLIDPLYLLVFVVVDIFAFAAIMMKGSTSPYR